MKNLLYQQDFVQWTEEQAQHLQKQELDATILVRGALSRKKRDRDEIVKITNKRR
jgi:hypothetical protein